MHILFNGKRWALLLALTCLVVLQLHNLAVFPATRGLDATTHIDYILFLRTQHRVPRANEGWELYQPPLYYFLGSLLPSPILVKTLNYAMWLVLLAVSYLFFLRAFKSQTVAATGSILIGALPVAIYLTPPIGNEFFSGMMITATLVFYILVFLPSTTHQVTFWKTDILFGVLLGAAILSKSTALTLVLAIFLERLIALRGNMLKVFRQLMIPFSVMIIVGGWFYVRNIVFFHNPVASSADFPPFSSYGQQVVPRDFHFFTDLSGFYTFDFFHAQNYSFLAGTFFSWFYDGHNVIVPVQPFTKLGITIFLLSLPLFFLAVLGYFLSFRKITDQNRVLLIYPPLLIAAYIAYNFKLPYYSTVKGLFLVSLILPFGFFLIFGVKKNLPKPLLALVPYFVLVYCLLIVKQFWVISWWYAQ